MAQPKVHIVIYSLYNHVHTLALSVLEGLESKGIDAKLFQVEETLSEDVLHSMHAPPRPDLPIATPSSLLEADGIIFGIPTRFGMVPEQIKTLLDSTGQLWATGSLIGKFAATFFSTASQHGGQETTALTTVSYFAHHGMLYVPFGFANVGLFDNSEVIGGSPYGAGTITNGDGTRHPTVKELDIAKNQGENFAKLLNTYMKGKAAIGADADASIKSIKGFSINESRSSTPIVNNDHSLDSVDSPAIGPDSIHSQTDVGNVPAVQDHATGEPQSNPTITTTNPDGQTHKESIGSPTSNIAAAGAGAAAGAAAVGIGAASMTKTESSTEAEPKTAEKPSGPEIKKKNMRSIDDHIPRVPPENNVPTAESPLEHENTFANETAAKNETETTKAATPAHADTIENPGQRSSADHISSAADVTSEPTGKKPSAVGPQPIEEHTAEPAKKPQANANTSSTQAQKSTQVPKKKKKKSLWFCCN